jgi:hypothetical protein
MRRAPAGLLCSRNRALVAVPVLLVLSAITLAGCERSIAVDGLFMYSVEDVGPDKFAGCSEARAWEIQRNADGSRLYCTFWCDGEVRVLVRGDTDRVLKAPANRSFLGDETRFVAWCGDSGRECRFSNGFTRKMTSYDQFGVDPSGQYYFAALAADRTVIAAVAQPHVALYESRLRCRKMFVQDRRLYLIGASTDYTTSDDQEIPVEIVAERPTGWTLERALTLKRGRSGPAPFYVADMDPYVPNACSSWTSETCRSGGGCIFTISLPAHACESRATSIPGCSS